MSEVMMSKHPNKRLLIIWVQAHNCGVFQAAQNFMADTGDAVYGEPAQQPIIQYP